MRKPRDIEAELKALQEKAKQLKTKQKAQLGELVIATGADALDMETLAGLLLGAVDVKDADKKEGWRRRGQEFFQRRSRRKQSATANATQGSDGDSNGAQTHSGSAETN